MKFTISLDIMTMFCYFWLNNFTFHIMVNIGKKIRKIRELKNLKQEFIASELNMSIRGYSKIENEETQITINRLVEIANVLDVDPLEIIQFNFDFFVKREQNISLNENQELNYLIQSITELKLQNKKIMEYILQKK